MTDAAPIKKLLNMVILLAIRDQASDIHLEPFEDENAPKSKESKTTEKPSTADAGDQETDGELF